MDWLKAIHVQWSSCLWCLYTVVTVAVAPCPDGAVEKAMQCTASLGLGPPSETPANAFVERGQIAKAKQACRDHTFEEAISCLEDITEACQGSSDQEHFLRNMVDAPKARDYVTFFCSHLNEYEEYAPCIGRKHSTLTQCVHQQRRTMETKVKASNNMDFLMTSTCKYLNAAEMCSERVLSASCGASAASMVARVFTAFKPPVCHSVPYSTDQNAQSDDDTSGASPSGSRTTSMAEVTSWIGLLFVGLMMVAGWKG